MEISASFFLKCKFILLLLTWCNSRTRKKKSPLYSIRKFLSKCDHAWYMNSKYSLRWTSGEKKYNTLVGRLHTETFVKWTNFTTLYIVLSLFFDIYFALSEDLDRGKLWYHDFCSIFGIKEVFFSRRKNFSSV